MYYLESNNGRISLRGYAKTTLKKLTTTIPLLGGSGNVLHRAGSHLGILDHVPLLHLKLNSIVARFYLI